MTIGQIPVIDYAWLIDGADAESVGYVGHPNSVDFLEDLSGAGGQTMSTDSSGLTSPIWKNPVQGGQLTFSNDSHGMLTGIQSLPDPISNKTPFTMVGIWARRTIVLGAPPTFETAIVIDANVAVRAFYLALDTGSGQTDSMAINAGETLSTNGYHPTGPQGWILTFDGVNSEIMSHDGVVRASGDSGTNTMVGGLFDLFTLSSTSGAMWGRGGAGLNIAKYWWTAIYGRVLTANEKDAMARMMTANIDLINGAY